MIHGKRHQSIRGLNSTKCQKRQPVEQFRIRLVQRPHAVEYARVYICWTNRRSVFKSELMGSSQVIEESDAADKPDTVIETKEGCIHKRWRGYEMVGRIVVARRGHNDNARGATTLKARNASMRMSVTRIVSAVGARNARRLR